jgi:hypothetical protein
MKFKGTFTDRGARTLEKGGHGTLGGLAGSNMCHVAHSTAPLRVRSAPLSRPPALRSFPQHSCRRLKSLARAASC